MHPGDPGGWCLLFVLVSPAIFLLPFAWLSLSQRLNVRLATLGAAVLDQAAMTSGWLVFPVLYRDRIVGRLGGRPAELKLTSLLAFAAGLAPTRLTVQVENPVAGFSIRPRSDLLAFLRAGKSVQTGQRAIDRKYFLEGSAEDLLALFDGTEVDRELEAIFRHGGTVVRLDAERKELTVELRPLRYFDASYGLGQAWPALGRLAAYCDRRELKIDVLGEESHYVWTGGTDQPRCPFCRDDFQTTDEDLAACEYCDTVHHAECLEEAGGCTVLGCRGGQVRRERARS